jgi:hypothetical protein
MSMVMVPGSTYVVPLAKLALLVLVSILIDSAIWSAVSAIKLVTDTEDPRTPNSWKNKWFMAEWLVQVKQAPWILRNSWKGRSWIQLFNAVSVSHC